VAAIRSIGQSILPAVRYGGQLAAVREFQGTTERDIRIHRVVVTDYLTNRTALAELGRLVSAERLTLRVAKTFPPEQVGDAHRALAAGGVRGRLLIRF
jgi:D-arabinose 1-dehydrogenase-like Zn-dependent alcohol dehydrogenase